MEILIKAVDGSSTPSHTPDNLNTCLIGWLISCKADVAYRWLTAVVTSPTDSGTGFWTVLDGLYGSYPAGGTSRDIWAASSRAPPGSAVPPSAPSSARFWPWSRSSWAGSAESHCCCWTAGSGRRRTGCPGSGRRRWQWRRCGGNTAAPPAYTPGAGGWSWRWRSLRASWPLTDPPACPAALSRPSRCLSRPLTELHPARFSPWSGTVSCCCAAPCSGRRRRLATSQKSSVHTRPGRSSWGRTGPWAEPTR